ncbi:M48 family metallopeptidase [Luteimonas yindakuii]|uniref:M48 family metallopeptidase n=1 Tax=Luteimonas yindakuii TaxID=2565782 RepID=UPI0011077520|nr:M48 family metallopeptidase [Luteimonas yindakuii]QCU72417.1 M48 family metallopeptidase [Luteimonas yindakuii]
MNFFERQAQARRNTTRLVVLFALAVLCIVVLVDVAVLLFFGGSVGTLVGASIVTVMIIGLGSLYRMASLRAGGERVATQLGGVAVPEDTADPQLRRLRNVVEEMAIASGVPVPALFVLEQEQGINAFAAGYSPTDAAVAVTRGALERLNRDELQGVIAHEFSHVLNGDMRINIRLMGVLFGILMLGLIGRRILLHAGGARGRDATFVMLMAVICLVIGYAGVFFGRMIKAGVSRSREVLADASAVQFTRQTQGLAGALKKIGGVGEGSRLQERADAEEISHMLFGDGIGLSGLFATHPPLLRRIQALEPGFTGEQMTGLQARWLRSPPNGLEEDVQLGLAARDDGALPSPHARLAVTAPMVAAHVAEPEDQDWVRAGAIVASIPVVLQQAARRRDEVMPLLFALLLDGDDGIRGRQRAEIVARMGMPVADLAIHLRDAMHELHPMQRLPLAQLAFPVLRLRPRPELAVFLDVVEAMVHADRRVSLFEYCLGRLLQVQVTESLDPGRHARFGRQRAGNVRQEFAALLAVVAQAGHPDDADAARRAYLAGLQRVLPRDHVAYTPPEDPVQALDAVWDPLDRLEPLAKQMLVEAITDAILHDGRISVPEAELLRTVCAVLHCPLPPVLDR